MEILCEIQGKEFVMKILQIYEIVDSDFRDVRGISQRGFLVACFLVINQLYGVALINQLISFS